MERAYGLQMNAKEILIAAARRGCAEGFDSYDSTHESSLCIHCHDHLCEEPSPPNPLPWNRCDDVLCSRCFREREAREASEEGGLRELRALFSHVFDDEFSMSFGETSIEAQLEAREVSNNGFGLRAIRFKSPLMIGIRSEKHGISGTSRLPSGLVVQYGGL